jgi:hypothetical protein
VDVADVSEPLSEWLRVMLDEIASKRQDAERAAAERRARAEEKLPRGQDVSAADSSRPYKRT